MSAQLLKWILKLNLLAGVRRNDSPEEILTHVSCRAISLVDAGEDRELVAAALDAVINQYGLVDQPVPFKVVRSLN